MGLGRANPVAAAALSVIAIGLTGCGAQSFENRPRPPLPPEVTVVISDTGVNVGPSTVGTDVTPNAPLDQNAKVDSPDAKDGPLIIVFTVANTTDTDTKLEIKGPATDRPSETIYANGTGDLKIKLATGEYTISAADIPRAKPAKFTVGPVRLSSQNDLLLP